MSDLRSLVKEVLKDGYLMSLGVVDESGPWVADVIYVFDDSLNLYWLSLPSRRHSKAIGEGASVASAITVDERRGHERGVQLCGKAEPIGSVPFELERAHRSRRNMEEPKRPGELTEDGHRWYRLTPASIELIHDELFPRDRQKVL